jgi:hypothetical protein
MAAKAFRDRVVELRRVRAGELRPNPAQWRVHTKPQVAALRGILAEIGFAGAALAYQDADSQLTLVDGHMRSGLDPNAVIPVLVLDVDAEEARKLLATYDPLGAMAQHDQEALLTLLESVKFQDQAVNDLLEALANDNYQSLTPLLPLHEPQPDPGPQIDRAAELQQKWGTARGQVWEIGKHRLYCADCLTATGISVDLGFTSPPYAVGKEYEEGISFEDHLKLLTGLSQIGLNVIRPGGFFVINFGEIAAQSHTKLLTGSDRQCLYPISGDYWRIFRAVEYDLYAQCIWYKPFNRLQQPFWTYHTSIPHYQEWEHLWTWRLPGGDGDRVYDWEISSRAVWDTRQEGTEDHPLTRHVAAFPVCLPERVLRAHSDEGAVVWEPFCGSGTTMVAAERLNRTCIAYEIEPKYVAVALERMAGMGLEPRLVS